MKVIGLLGGMSWASSLEYYRIINEVIAERLGGCHSARLVLYSFDFAEIERYQREGRWDDAAKALTDAGVALRAAGADFLLICTNLMHKVADVVAEKTGLPLLHIVDVVGNAVSRRGVRKVGLLGARFTMKEDFYRGRLEECFNIEVIIPAKKERTIVDCIIFDELVRGKLEASSRQMYIDIINGLVEKGAQGIILGCTELPLLLKQSDVHVPLFDTTRLHAEAAAELALAKR